MKNKIFYFLLIILSICMVGTVRAEDFDESVGDLDVDEVVTLPSGGTGNTCTADKKVSLRTMASNVKMVVEPYIKTSTIDNLEETQSGEVESFNQYYVKIKIYNINSQLRGIVTDSANGATKEISSKNIGEDGAITLTKKVSDVSTSYVSLDVMGANGSGCFDDSLRKMKVTVPMYNNFSEREVCAEVPEFYMCQQYVTYKINPKNFSRDLETFKKKQLTQAKQNKDNTTIGSKVVETVSEHKAFSIIVVLCLGGIITYIILKKRGSVF